VAGGELVPGQKICGIVGVLTCRLGSTAKLALPELLAFQNPNESVAANAAVPTRSVAAIATASVRHARPGTVGCVLERIAASCACAAGVSPRVSLGAIGLARARLRGSSAGFSCLASGHQPLRRTQRGKHQLLLYRQLQYRLIDQIRTAGHLDRAEVQQGLTRGLARGRLSARTVRRLDAELAAAPDSFRTHLNELWRFSTYSTTYATPPGQVVVFIASGAPTLLVCEPHDLSAVECQNLNGDTHAPIGAGIYAVVPGPGLKLITAPSPGSQPSAWRLARAVFGPDFTPAAQRLLWDLIKVMTAASTTTITGS
jgi:hypothetical protein